MPLELSKLDAEVDFPALTKCLFESYDNPLQNFVNVYFAPRGEDETAHEERLKEASNRFADWHANDPSSYWQKVVDTETGEIAGGALWNIHLDNPFAQPHSLEVTWLPDDGSRKFAEEFLRQYDIPRALVGQKPQVYLFIIFTSPAYRRRGVAQQFMSWGMNKADELGVEMFLDATPVGKPLYEANQFACIKENIIIPETETPDEAWKKIDSQVGTVTFHLMWRPIHGNYVEGKTMLPGNNE
ncbi:hypothetical protein E0Z10_g7523 [Xylaria hypoxylon]|uniref:N-acetyltransferase domain-containing protein n=1 Tax=Xylaria hypoxylon TaxID=37992 RepID=A0A4Z0YBD0_9PEZI|nr:hypothetical protein E0Z10_g7523 [Xylaria hypoxylon]